MSRSWSDALFSNEDVDVTGMLHIQSARISSDGSIIVDENGLIDRETASGTLVNKYISLNPFTIVYKRSGVIIGPDTLLTEDGEPLLTEDGEPLTI